LVWPKRKGWRNRQPTGACCVVVCRDRVRKRNNCNNNKNNRKRGAEKWIGDERGKIPILAAHRTGGCIRMKEDQLVGWDGQNDKCFSALSLHPATGITASSQCRGGRQMSLPPCSPDHRRLVAHFRLFLLRDEHQRGLVATRRSGTLLGKRAVRVARCDWHSSGILEIKSCEKT
jgi:hypothetical protein